MKYTENCGTSDTFSIFIFLNPTTNVAQTDSGFYRSYNAWAMMLMKDAFPERNVVMNELDKKCLPYEKSKYKTTDVIVCTWNNYDESLKTEIKKYRREHASERYYWCGVCH